MYLKKFIIRGSSGVIREVPFKRGLNIIVDETTSATTDSGNNVGKTTFLRAIYYCMGGQKSGIYTDKEFKKRDETVYSFLTKNNVEFELTLETKAGKEHRIIRPIEGKPSLDGIEMGPEALTDALLKLLFNSTGGRPTLAQLMSKFIRIEGYQLSNTLRFLFPTTDDSTYEALFLSLFGFKNTELLGRKNILVTQIKKLAKSLDNSPNTIKDLEQQLNLINMEILALEKTKDSLNFGKEVELDLAALKKIQIKTSELKSLIAQLNLKRELNAEALRQLTESKSNISTDSISKLYTQAKVEIIGLNKKFADVLQFHNQMLDNKAKYIESILTSLDAQLRDNTETLESELARESGIIGQMSKKGVLGEYDVISSKLQDINREKGTKEGILQSLSEIGKELLTANKELDKINMEIESFADKLSSNLKQFNIFFSAFSEELYNEKYYLSEERKKDRTTNNYLLTLGNRNENVGTGKKKAQISALDLAYLKYSDTANLTVPLFVLHDRVETVFENQLETLFDAANTLTGQFVVAVLSDKLHKIDKKKIEDNCILRLSQSSKLFKF